MTKINLFDLNLAFSDPIDMYINTETGKIIEDYDHHLLSKKAQKQYIISPKFTKKGLVKIIGKYVKENSITAYIYDENDDDDDIIQNFDYWLEDNNLLYNYIDFLRIEEYKLLIEWCKKNNYEYYYEVPPMYRKSEEEIVDEIIEKVKNEDPTRQEYYRNYTPRNIQ